LSLERPHSHAALRALHGLPLIARSDGPSSPPGVRLSSSSV
jgi:hypothetical protein